MRLCLDCSQNKPRCSQCGIPMASALPHGVCSTCSQSLRFCLACGRPVKNKYYQFDDLGPYCQECYQTRPRCDVCNAPLTHEYWQLSDGRVICAHCHSTAIYDPAAAAALYSEMRQVVDQLLGLRLNIPTGVALVDRNQLREVIRRQTSAVMQGHPSPASALPLEAENTLGLYARRGIRRGIYIQTGLPRLLFLQIAAHEYAHAWQAENYPLLRDERIHEGFAEWVAYRVIGNYGYTRGQERMLSRQDIYGQGLRWALELEAQSGVQGVINALSTESD